MHKTEKYTRNITHSREITKQLSTKSQYVDIKMKFFKNTHNVWFLCFTNILILVTVFRISHHQPSVLCN